MINFILASQNSLFLLSIVIMLALVLLELLSLFAGTMLSEMLDSILPDMDVDADVANGGLLGACLGWLYVGRLPTLILLILFLLSFGLAGYIAQYVSLQWSGSLQPLSVIVYPAVAGMLLFVHYVGGVLVRLMPDTETSAISEEDFVGQMVTITIGEAKRNWPAEAKFTDQFQQTHYLMVEPLDDEAIYNREDELQVVEKINSIYQVIKIK